MADPARESAETRWRSIEELATVVGAYCWLEHRLFEVAGAWATRPEGEGADAASLRVWCAAASRRHGTLAERWAERLPVRARVDASALVVAPAGPSELPGALEELAAVKELGEGVGALVETVLPWVGGVYSAHLAVATPVSEASVMEVLVEAGRDGSAEIKGGRSLLRELAEAGKPSRHLGKTFERAFVDPTVFPAVRAS